MASLRKCLEKLLPKGSILKGASHAEQGITFSISKDRNDSVIGIKLNPFQRERYPEEKIADAIFVCHGENQKIILIIIVELKKGNKEKAIKQIVNTRKLLCASSKLAGLFHSAELRNLRPFNGRNHNGKVVALIIGKGQLLQQKIAAENKKNPDLEIYGHSTNNYNKSLVELYNEFKSWTN